MIKVKEINGSTIKLEVRSFSYQGNFMGESYISFDVNSPVYINFEIGDYIEYRGERFVLNYIPSPIKNGTPGKSGDAFVYMDVKFNSLADELTRCDFLDVVLSDNHVHFTSLSKFSFYAATVKDLADRIQANLNRLYNGGEAWTVTVEEDVAVKDKSLSVDNINCWEALSLVNSDFDANFVISGRTIRIGTAGISVGTVFGYGKGNGLINIEQSTNNDSLIVTRLRAYGSTRNIPYRYYNNLKDSNGTPLIPESMYVNTLMLPGFAENGGDAYVDSPNITRIGIREKSVYFDGSGGLPEIYPSIEGMTAEELKAAGINVNATGRIDEVVSAEQMTDDGIVPEDKEELDKKTFTITLKDIGFNPVDKKHLTTETPFISMKTGMCGGREFEITGCEEKGNNYILTCNREMDSSINKAFPNNPYQVSAGDQFVFIGIAMDDIYIKAAEQRLLTAAKDYLSNNDKSKYTYLPKIDKVFMARHPEIASSLKEGNILDFKDTDLGIDVSVIIQSLVIKEGGPVPEYEITLFNDKVVSTIEKIQNSITSLASNTGITIEQAKSLFATWVEAWRVKWFDQKLHTYDPVKFNSVTSTDFESKLKGWVIDALGNAEFRDVLLRSFKSWNFAAGPLGAGVGMVNDDELQTDKLLVRKIMYVLEMMIQRMRFQGGIMVLSPATGFKIDRVETFDTYYRVYCRPEDFNEFEVNDQARIQNFNGNNIKYLWSLVLSRGDDYIDISRVDKDGDGVPAEGDEIVQLGNRTNPDRQDAVLLSAVNSEVGLFTYFGINSFDLSGKEGSWFGKHGGKKGAVIRGEVHITSNSSGLDNFSEFEGVSQDIQDAQASANEAQRIAQEAQDFIDNTLPGELSEIRGIIDGQIESFFYNYDPTMSNYPASSWTTTEDKERHLNDTFTNTSTGASWRFLKEGNEYKWVEIADTATKEALKLAGEAKDTADSKRRVFVVEPVPPYEVGDLWAQGVSGDLMRCAKGRLSGSFVSSDWEKASKYTDDTKANEALQRMKDMADDNIITKEEKATLRDTWNQIQKEFTAYQAQATKYGVSITALQNAYNTLNTFLSNTVKILSTDEDTNLSVAQKTEYNQDFANYYSERTAFANVIAQKVADESVGNLQIGMVNLLKGSNVELNRQNYNIGRYYWDKIPETGKTYTLVVCYTLGTNNTYISAYSNVNTGSVIKNFSTHGDKVVESHTFTPSREFGDSIDFYQFPNDGTYGSKVHWAVLVEGNKGPNAWIPSLSEQGETAAKNEVNNLQIGSVNLVSKKMLLNINNTAGSSAIWGQDSDGIYISVAPKDNTTLYSNFKNGTQYVISVNCKGNPSGGSSWRPYLNVEYTDGTMESAWLTKDSVYNRHDYISKQGKTIARVYWNVANGGQTYSNFIYDLAVYEGNKVLAEPPVATEDLTGQSNVNLVDGGKEVTVTSSASDQWGNRILVIPKLKPNTVYYLSFKAENLTGSPTAYSAILSNKEITTTYHRLDSVSGGIMITPNNFIEGEAKLFLYAGKGGSTAGNSVKYKDVMLVEGFTPPSSYSPSPGDIDQAIQDAIAKTVDITAPSQVFKYGPGYTGTPTPSSIVLTATPRNFTPTSYQWQFLNGSTWINITIDGASSTYSVNPNSTTLFPSGTNVRTFRCICNGDEKLSDSFTLAKLADGATGQPGADGRGVKSTAVTYQSSTSGTTVPTGTWSASIPAVAAGSYLWTKTVITYTSGDPSTMYSVARMGTNGTNGNNGNGVSSTVITYQASTSGTTAPTGTWGSTIPSVPAGQYLWTRTVINYTNGSSSTIYSVGMTGKTGADGKDAYTILLGNESHAFAGSTAAALAGSTTCSVVAYKGATRVAATIGTISGLPTGMTASVASNGTTTPVITFTVTTSMTTASGTVNIPVTVDGKTFTKVFSYSIAFRGDPGESINGKMLYKDPEFKKGLNNVYKYTNSSNVDPDYIASKLTVERVTKPSDAPTQSGYCLKVTCKAAQAPGYGGVYQFITSRANAVFVQKIIAKIPVGYKINTASNSMVTGYTDTWLTPTEGTGKYTTYLRKVVCGTTGNFSTGGHVYITGNPAPSESVPLEWYIASMTCFDQTSDGYADIEITTKDSFAMQMGYTSFQDMIDQTVAKGGKLIVNGLLNAKLIDVNTLVADTALVDKLIGRELNFTLGSVGGFKMESTLLYSGAKFGTGGAGIAMQSMTNNYGFNVYKDNNNYMEMFQRSSEWGLKGVVGGKTILQLGSTNKIGGFDITDDRIGSIFGTGGVGNGMSLYNFVVKFKSDNSEDSRFAALGTSVYPSSTAQSTLLRLEETRSGNLDNILSYFYCSGASGVLDSRNIAIKVGNGDVDIDNGNLNMAAGNFMKMKGQIHFDNVVTYTGSGAVTITADSGHFIYLTPITGNPVVSVSSGLPIGSWFIIAHTTTAGGYYYIKLSGSDRFRRRGNAYQQVNSHNQDPSLIFKVSDTTWIIGNLPVNWIDWN